MIDKIFKVKIGKVLYLIGESTIKMINKVIIV